MTSGMLEVWPIPESSFISRNSTEEPDLFEVLLRAGAHWDSYYEILTIYSRTELGTSGIRIDDEP